MDAGAVSRAEEQPRRGGGDPGAHVQRAVGERLGAERRGVAGPAAEGAEEGTAGQIERLRITLTRSNAVSERAALPLCPSAFSSPQPSYGGFILALSSVYYSSMYPPTSPFGSFLGHGIA